MILRLIFAVVLITHSALAADLKIIVRDGDYADLKRALANEDWSKEELGEALLAASGLNEPRKAALLLMEGANPNYSILGNNSVVLAVREDSLQTLNILLSRGGDPNFRSLFDWRPLHHAILPHHSNRSIILLLLEHGASVNATTNLKVTPLHRAAGFCDASAARILLEHGADKGLREKYGRTAAQRAEQAGCPELAKELR